MGGKYRLNSFARMETVTSSYLSPHTSVVLCVSRTSNRPALDCIAVTDVFGIQMSHDQEEEERERVCVCVWCVCGVCVVECVCCSPATPKNQTAVAGLTFDPPTSMMSEYDVTWLWLCRSCSTLYAMRAAAGSEMNRSTFIPASSHAFLHGPHQLMQQCKCLANQLVRACVRVQSNVVMKLQKRERERERMRACE